MPNKTVFHCNSCKRNLVHVADCSTGYGIDRDTNDKYCFHCCGEMDKDTMANCKPGDKFILYLTMEPYPTMTLRPRMPGYAYPNECHVGNWPGTLKIQVNQVKIGRHNIAHRRYDVWFNDHTGAHWHGTQYGDNTQICHCRKLKTEE